MQIGFHSILRLFACKMNSGISFYGKCSNSNNDFICVCPRNDSKMRFFHQKVMIYDYLDDNLKSYLLLKYSAKREN